jgi:hypothetical protein
MYTTRLFALVRSDSLRPLLDDPKGRDSQRNIVLSRDTFVVLEFNFTPGPGHSLAFDALEIPANRFVSYAVDRKGQQPLPLRILLMDAITGMYVRASEWDREEEDERTLASSLVDFQAEHNIIDLRDGKAAVRFRLPCCISMHRTVSYR